ncbi:MAG: metallophosphoesterase [Mycobacterium sp.]
MTNQGHYDIIGDVHGCATKLTSLLGELGYRPDGSGVYRHPERTAVFVGDLIDRGDEQLQVLTLVKAMVDAGSAQIVMGNHEFNAICWATRFPAGHSKAGEPLREHSEHNDIQHAAFTALSPEDQAYWIEWFKTLPLWLDLGGIRVVHACWHEESMKAVLDATGNSGRLSTVEHYVYAVTKGSDLYEAVEVLLKGPEIPLLDYDMEPYWDHESQKWRKKARIKWWDHDASTLPALAELRGAKLKNGDRYPEVESRRVDEKYLGYVYTDHIPLFYGHYWREWEPVETDDWTTYTACVDFSAVRGGTMVAYRWSGETEIRFENYVPHDPHVVAPTPSDVTD